MRSIIFIFLIYLSLQVNNGQTDTVDPVAQPCECVPYNLCSANNSIITDGVGIIIIREQGDCPNYSHVCCNPADKTTTVMPTTRHTGDVDKVASIFGNIEENDPVARPCECVPHYLCSANNSITNDGREIVDIREQGECPSYLDVCCNPADKTTAVIPIIKNVDCGYRNPDGVGFTITGDQDNEAQFGEFPWMVAVLAEEFIAGTGSILNPYKCGGSLIHPQAVLTAAHCVSVREKKYKIRAGEWDTQTTKELIPHQDRYVKSTVIHSEYYAEGIFNDVAILFLESPVDITKTTKTLCLPSQDFVVPSGTRCYASGWGKDVFGRKGKFQVILKKIDLPIVNRETCQDKLRHTRLGKNFILDKSFVCAGGEEGKDTCKGDGGSPLACPIPGQKDRYQQVGIVAWGIGCGEDMVPGVYVNVAIFRSWIDEQLSAKNLDTSHYQY